MDSLELLEKIAMLKSINDSNAKNLLKLGIDMNALPSDIESEIKEIVDIQRKTGLHELDAINLNLWHLQKQEEVVNLEQVVLKPLQRKMKRLDGQIDHNKNKLKALEESINDAQKEIISDAEFHSRSEEIGLGIAVAEKGITETPLPPVKLDCDQLIKQVNDLRADKKSKGKVVKKY